MATSISAIIGEVRARLAAVIDEDVIRFGASDKISANKKLEVSIKPQADTPQKMRAGTDQGKFSLDIEILRRGAESLLALEADRELLHKALIAGPDNLNSTCLDIQYKKSVWDYAEGDLPITQLTCTYEFTYVQEWSVYP